MFKTSEELAKSFQMGYPLKGINPGSISQGFGENATTFYKDLGLRGHNGIDFSVPIGTELYATFDGTIEEARTWPSGGVGIYLVSRSKGTGDQSIRLRAIYWHLSGVAVKKGDMVSKGQLIGYSGNTGRYTTGPHLHFGIKPYYKSGEEWKAATSNGYWGAVDPMPMFEGDDTEIYPVDRQYGMEDDAWYEHQKELFKKDIYVLNKFNRTPTERELVALSYGCIIFGTQIQELNLELK